MIITRQILGGFTTLIKAAPSLRLLYSNTRPSNIFRHSVVKKLSNAPLQIRTVMVDGKPVLEAIKHRKEPFNHLDVPVWHCAGAIGSFTSYRLAVKHSPEQPIIHSEI